MFDREISKVYSSYSVVGLIKQRMADVSIWKLSMNIEQFLHDKRNDIRAIAAKHGAYNIRIFGSIVRGEAGPDSDIDFLVDAGPNTSSWFPAGLILDLEKVLGRRVEVVTEKALNPYIREYVLAEVKPL